MKAEMCTKGIIAEPYGLQISVPRNSFTLDQIEILRQMLQSKEQLIKKALGASTLDFEVRKDRIVFPWFNHSPVSADVEPILIFVSALCDRAKSGKPAPKLKDYESERYTFNHFLTSLGLDSPEYQQTRKQLMKNLSGSVPFPDRQSELAHYERQKEKKNQGSASPASPLFLDEVKWIPE